MNEKHVELETELQALRPRELSPELRQRIAARLSVQPRLAWRPRVSARLALVGALVAASLLSTILWTRGPGARILDLPNPSPAIEGAEALPTFWAYQHALGQSPEALEALLDKQAVLALATQQRSQRVHAFPLANTDLVD